MVSTDCPSSMHLAYGHLMKELWVYAYDWAVNDGPMIRAGYLHEQLPHDALFFYPPRTEFRQIAEILFVVGLLKTVGKLPLFAFTCERNDVVRLIVERHDWGPPFDEVLKLCGWMFREYGTEYRGLSFKEGKGFRPADQMKDTMAALEQVGLVRKESDRFFWAGQMLAVNHEMEQASGPALV